MTAVFHSEHFGKPLGSHELRDLYVCTVRFLDAFAQLSVLNDDLRILEALAQTMFGMHYCPGEGLLFHDGSQAPMAGQ